ncbi:uncharacterized protein [Dendrobates tinctorius]|uniref:uncharacterized protein n=1 Tax=Dendrobates tinctorius TaxID=92724 RepID=UPI003CC97B99
MDYFNHRLLSRERLILQVVGKIHPVNQEETPQVAFSEDDTRTMRTLFHTLEDSIKEEISNSLHARFLAIYMDEHICPKGLRISLQTPFPQDLAFSDEWEDIQYDCMQRLLHCLEKSILTQSSMNTNPGRVFINSNRGKNQQPRSKPRDPPLPAVPITPTPSTITMPTRTLSELMDSNINSFKSSGESPTSIPTVNVTPNSANDMAALIIDRRRSSSFPLPFFDPPLTPAKLDTTEVFDFDPPVTTDLIVLNIDNPTTSCIDKLPAVSTEKRLIINDQMASSSQVANSQDFIRLFTEMYRSLPCLWKVKSPDYSNKYKKKVAYEKLVQLYQENHPSETVDEAVIKKKIQALRTVFKKELNKVEKSTRSGAGTDEVYVPKLWYYNLLEFTRDQEIPRVMHCSMSLPQEEETVTRPDSPLVDHVTEEVSPTPCVIPETPATSNPTDEEAEEASVSVGAYTVQRRNPVSRKRKATAPPFPEFVDIAKNILVLQEKQAIGGFAHMVDERLRSLDVTQRLQAERIIFEALNKAAVGQLKDSYILVDSQAMSITPWPQTQELVTSTPRRYPLPLISDLFSRIKGACWFTKLDLRGAYNLIRIKHGDEWKTAFNTPEGHFEYLVMPFGLTNAPSVFQCFMNDIFRDFVDKFLIIYLDDILIFSKDWDSHVEHIRIVFRILRENSLYVKGSKCLFGVQRISFLGFILSPSTIEMDPAKVQAIYDWVQPTSLKDLQKFLGFANFYRKFIAKFSSIAKPLTDLTKKGADVLNWSPEAVSSFQELKRRFTSAPVLRQPDVSLLFQVEVDASEIGAGAVLSQKDPVTSKMNPCAFFSRKFSPSERNYDVGNRELLAMTWAFEEWRHWLEGAKHQVVVLTDHKNLIYLESAKRLNPRQARWALFFTRFDFVVSFLPGTKNVKADTLSRSFFADSPVVTKPATILGEGVVLSAISPDLRRALEEFQEDKPERCPSGKLYVPDQWKKRVMSEVHCSALAGHPGIFGTRDLVSRSFWWPSLSRDVRNFVQSCGTCSRSKSCSRSSGLLMPLPVPKRPWTHISMDFISDMPVSQRVTVIWYPLPLISDLFSRIKGACWFTKLDLRGAYNLIRIKHGDEWKTAFNTPEGHFEYLVMPFGLTNAPSVFQCFMNDIFRDFVDKFLIIYLDDILIFSKDWDSHVEHIRIVFRILRENSLYVKGSKCLFGVQRISFLGFILSPSTIEMDPAKVQAIYDWVQPTSLKDLQKFLGFANFYRKFIAKFSSIAKPLTDLTKKGADVLNWSPEAVSSFQELKRRFTSAPVLRQPDVSLLFQVEVDASEIGAGAVLSQKDPVTSKMNPCAFFSRKFSPSERNYDVGNRELLAMTWAFEEWRHWLEGAKHQVVVLTDHKNLIYLESAKRLNPRQARWALFFTRFDFVVSFLPGTKNVKADTLSRSFFADSPVVTKPATILGEGVVLSAISPDLRRALEEFQEDKPERCPSGKLYVPDQWKKRVMSEVHCSALAGHPGIFGTRDLVSRSFWWPSLSRDVRNFVQSCGTCSRSKSCSRSSGLLMPLPVPKRPWTHISMDFISDMPVSQRVTVIWYPLPLISDLFSRIKGACWFTKLDLRGAYNLIRIKHGDEWKTAFNTPEGHFEYLVMPFGLTNAPSVFQCFMNDIFRDFVDKFLIIYLDDILIFSKDWDSHVEHIRIVFRILRENSLYVKGSKCLFGVQRISFLGFILSPSTIEMDPAKVQAIYDWVQPTSLKDLQKFLGFANFYRKFIAKFSSIAKPLTDLTKKGADVLNWSPEAVSSFQELKRRFTSAPVLRQPDVSLLFQVEVDASEIGAGAVLSQKDPVTSKMNPCAFFSRKFSPSERNYDVGNRELLAMTWAFEEWRHWLEGAKHQVVVLTDHKNLIYLESAKRLNPRQARWALFFTRFDFVVSFLPGTKNVKADTLSRSFFADSPVVTKPATILGEGVVLSAISPDLRRALEEFQEDKPERCPSGKLYVPDQWKKRVMSEVHCSALAGHPGIFGTRDLVSRSFWWPSLSRDVRNFVQSCGTCSRSKSCSRSSGLLMPLPVPKRPWTHISMDFISDMPVSQRVTVIWVLVLIWSFSSSLDSGLVTWFSTRHGGFKPTSLHQTSVVLQVQVLIPPVTAVMGVL